MQNRQNRAIARRIQKLARVPACCQRSSFCFAVTDNTTNDQIGIIERGPVSMRDRVTKFAAFVNRARSLRRDVAGNSSGKRELLEEALQAFFVLRDVRIDFAVCAFEIRIRYEAGTAVSRSGDVDGIEIMLLDQAIQMYIDEVQSGCCAPVAKKPGFNVRDRSGRRKCSSPRASTRGPYAIPLAKAAALTPRLWRFRWWRRKACSWSPSIEY